MRYWRFVTFFLGLLIVGFLLFGRASTAQFVSDDWHWLSVAYGRQSVFPSLTTNYEGNRIGGSYNPVSSLWMNSLFRAFGVSSFPFHIGSIVIHSLNATLVGLLTMLWLKVFASHLTLSRSRFVSTWAAVLFLTWPTFVEAVSWVSSVPHLLATTFFLLTVLWYLLWRTQGKRTHLVLAVIASVLTFFSKDTALSLPFIIVLLEVMYQKDAKRRFNVQQFLLSFIVFIPAFVFLLMRYSATGLLFGTYAEQVLVVRPMQVLNTFLTFFEEMVSFGLLRTQWMSIFWNHPLLVGITGLLAVTALVVFVICKHATFYIVTLISFILTTVPFLFLGFNRLSHESERYTYLPAVFFIVLLAGVVHASRAHFIRYIAVGLVIACVVLTFIKTGAWLQAGSISNTIIQDFSRITRGYEMPRYYYVIALPDTVDGAHVFRNNIREALTLTDLSFKGTIEQMPVYLMLKKRNAFAPVVQWSSDERGFFAHSVSGQNVVTGVDRRHTDRYIFELWNYDYLTFSSDTIRLIFNPHERTRLITGQAVLLSWHLGSLRIIPYTGNLAQNL